MLVGPDCGSDLRQGLVMKVCVQCGEVKRESNGWLAIWVSRCGVKTFHVRHMEAADNSPEFEIVCGENCAHRVLQQFLDRMRIEQ